MDPSVRAWDILKGSGFSKFDLVHSEFSSPLALSRLFDSKLECYNVVCGLHGDDYSTTLALSDAAILFEWSEKCSSLFSNLEREERQKAKRFRLLSPPRVAASDVYSELLGLDAKLQCRVSKSYFRSQLKNPSASKTELEAAARETWLAELVGILQEADLPICSMVDTTSDPLGMLKRSFGSRRMKTLRNRARSWRKVREWLISFKGKPFPSGVADMLDFLHFLVQEGATISRVNDVCASLSVLEDAGQVPDECKISGCRLWKQAVKSRIAELEVGNTHTNRAPPLSTAMIIALEVLVTDVDKPTYLRGVAWIVLICVWGCMRIDDLAGLDPKRLSLSSRGLKGFLVRTKTTGPGKNVKEVPFYIARKISLSGHDWLKSGLDIWLGYGCPDRDYFVFIAGANFWEPIQRYASTERVASYVRLVFAALEQPFKPRFSKWKVRSDSPLLSESGVLFWSGHSMRHFIPSVAAAINIPKDQRDYVGRWHVNFHQSADYVHTSRQIVVQVQERVNRALCEGGPAYDECELMEEFADYLKVRTEDHEPELIPHKIFKTGTDGPTLGGIWPILDEIETEEKKQSFSVDPDGTQAAASSDQLEKAPYFISVSRRSGFRRLHKTYCCGVMPWQCYKFEWVHEVSSGSADAHCKNCLRACGKSSTLVESSSSGSSSSTDEDRAPDETLDDWEKVSS